MTPLLRRSSSADAAFERLYRRHVTDVYRYAYAVLGEQADAEDVTQTTFLNAYRAYQRGERAEKPENWLIAIAHNVCRQRFRQAQRRPEVALDGVEPVAPEREGPTAEDLRRAFAQLPPNQREALVMRELEGRPYAEIAELMGISTSALETLIFRARRSLREQLEEQLTCEEAGFALSQQADGRLSGAGKRALRAHLRACPECARAAQRDRAIRGALKSMLAVPLPQSLASFFGGAAGSTATVGVGAKAVAIVAAGAVAAGGGTYVAKREHAAKPPAPPVAAAAVRAAPRPSDPVIFTGSEHVKAAAPKGRALGRAKARHAAKPAHVPQGRALGHAKATHVPPGKAKGHAKAKPAPPGKALGHTKAKHAPRGKAKGHAKPKRVPPGKAKGHAKASGGHGRGHR
jgi:RNA polymerase sigma factor (sigma-70 family)